MTKTLSLLASASLILGTVAGAPAGAAASAFRAPVRAMPGSSARGTAALPALPKTALGGVAAVPLAPASAQGPLSAAASGAPDASPAAAAAGVTAAAESAAPALEAAAKAETGADGSAFSGRALEAALTGERMTTVDPSGSISSSMSSSAPRLAAAKAAVADYAASRKAPASPKTEMEKTETRFLGAYLAVYVAAAAAGAYAFYEAGSQILMHGEQLLRQMMTDPAGFGGMTLGAFGIGGTLGASPSRLRSPVDHYGAALELAAKAAGVPAGKVLFLRATASMPPVQGQQWRYAFAVRSKGGAYPAEIIEVSASELLAGGLPTFNTIRFGSNDGHLKGIAMSHGMFAAHTIQTPESALSRLQAQGSVGARHSVTVSPVREGATEVVHYVFLGEDDSFGEVIGTGGRATLYRESASARKSDGTSAGQLAKALFLRNGTPKAMKAASIAERVLIAAGVGVIGAWAVGAVPLAAAGAAVLTTLFFLNGQMRSVDGALHTSIAMTLAALAGVGGLLAAGAPALAVGVAGLVVAMLSMATAEVGGRAGEAKFMLPFGALLTASLSAVVYALLPMIAGALFSTAFGLFTGDLEIPAAVAAAFEKLGALLGGAGVMAAGTLGYHSSFVSDPRETYAIAHKKAVEAAGAKPEDVRFVEASAMMPARGKQWSYTFVSGSDIVYVDFARMLGAGPQDMTTRIVRGGVGILGKTPVSMRPDLIGRAVSEAAEPAAIAARREHPAMGAPVSVVLSMRADAATGDLDAFYVFRDKSDNIAERNARTGATSFTAAPAPAGKSGSSGWSALKMLLPFVAVTMAGLVAVAGTAAALLASAGLIASGAWDFASLAIIGVSGFAAAAGYAAYSALKSDFFDGKAKRPPYAYLATRSETHPRIQTAANILSYAAMIPVTASIFTGAVPAAALVGVGIVSAASRLVYERLTYKYASDVTLALLGIQLLLAGVLAAF